MSLERNCSTTVLRNNENRNVPSLEFMLTLMEGLPRVLSSLMNVTRKVALDEHKKNIISNNQN